jgi:hypothetical protein
MCNTHPLLVHFVGRPSCFQLALTAAVRDKGKRVRAPTSPVNHEFLFPRIVQSRVPIRWLPGRTSQLPDEPRDLELVLDSEFAAAEAVQSETHQSQAER